MNISSVIDLIINVHFLGVTGKILKKCSRNVAMVQNCLSQQLSYVVFKPYVATSSLSMQISIRS